MNRLLNLPHAIYCLLIVSLFLFACQADAPRTAEDSAPAVTKVAQTGDNPREFDRYWNQGNAELSSYHLQQARYGEIHEGEAVLIFVAEDFSAKRLVKLNNPNGAGDDLVRVLKLNFTKKFNTGLYPYSMMSSAFTPVDLQKHAASLKTTMSSQEWCGHTFTQLNLRGRQYEVSGLSYFEQEGEEFFKLDKAWLEDEIWNRIRIAPESLPTGTFEMIPGSFYTRLRHVPLKVETATATLEKDTNDPAAQVYQLNFAAHNRTLRIRFQRAFPHEILGWEESYPSGFGAGAKMLSTRATLNKSILTDYWNHNSVADSVWRDRLGLE